MEKSFKETLENLRTNPDIISTFFGNGSFSDDCDMYFDKQVDSTILDELNSALYDIDTIEDENIYKEKAIKIIDNILKKLKNEKTL